MKLYKNLPVNEHMYFANLQDLDRKRWDKQMRIYEDWLWHGRKHPKKLSFNEKPPSSSPSITPISEALRHVLTEPIFT